MGKWVVLVYLVIDPSSPSRVAIRGLAGQCGPAQSCMAIVKADFAVFSFVYETGFGFLYFLQGCHRVSPRLPIPGNGSLARGYGPVIGSSWPSSSVQDVIDDLVGSLTCNHWNIYLVKVHVAQRSRGFQCDR